MRVGTITPEGSPYHAATVAALRRIEASSGGQVRFVVFGGGAAGDEPTLVTDLAAGKGLPAIAVTGTAAEAVVPEIAAFSLPFLFKDGTEADAVMEEVWPKLTELFARRGFWLMAHTVVGFRHIGSKTPVHTMEDLRKLVVRSQPGAVHERMWQLAGVSYRPLGQLAVLPELEAGRITGFDGPLPWIVAASWHSQVRQLVLTNHMYQPGFMFMGKQGFGMLPRGFDRQSAMTGVLAVCRQSNEETRNIEAQITDGLRRSGFSIEAPQAELQAAFRAAVLPVHAEWRAKASADGRRLLASILRAIERVRRKAR